MKLIQWIKSYRVRCDRCKRRWAMRYRQDTKFVDEEKNWVTLCRCCRKDNDEHWRDMWSDYHSGCL